MMIRTMPVLGIVPAYRFEEGSPLLISIYEQLKSEHHGKQIELNPEVSDYIKTLERDYDEVLKLHLWDQLDELEKGKKQNRIQKMVSSYGAKLGKVIGYLNLNKLTGFIQHCLEYDNDQKQLGKSIFDSRMSYFESKRFKFQTVRSKKKTKNMYQSYAEMELDLKVPFVFCLLQYQPEKSTCPLGGPFVDQILMVELLADCLPEGWMLYVKDHPSQYVKNYSRYGNKLFRDKRFYDRIRKCPNTRIVSIDQQPFALMDVAKVLASVGGSALWEGVVRGKPGLCFGSSWIQHCEGIFQIDGKESLQKALRSIHDGAQFSADNVKLYAKAISKIGIKGTVGGIQNLEYHGLDDASNAKEHFRGFEQLMKHHHCY